MVVGRCVPRERASEVASVRACNAHGLCLSLCAAADTAAKLFSHGSALLPPPSLPVRSLGSIPSFAFTFSSFPSTGATRRRESCMRGSRRYLKQS